MNLDESLALISYEAQQSQLEVQRTTEAQELIAKKNIDRIRESLHSDILFKCPLFYFYFNNINNLTKEDLQKLTLTQLAALEMEVCLKKTALEIRKFQSLLPYAAWAF